MKVAKIPLWSLATAMAMVCTPAMAQDSEDRDETADIVVTGEEEPVEALPIQTEESATVSIGTRQVGSEAGRFARCVPQQPPQRLRAILDERPNGPVSEGALHDYVVRNRGCYGTMSYQPRAYYGQCNPQIVSEAPPVFACRSLFDRGLLFEQAVMKQARSIDFSKETMAVPGVTQRFLAREDERNATRAQPQKTFFFAVSCMIRINPEYALLLLESEPNSDAETEMRARLIGNGSACLGGITDVQVDSNQFRVFTAEAVYGWMAAIAGKQTLVEDS